MTQENQNAPMSDSLETSIKFLKLMVIDDDKNALKSLSATVDRQLKQKGYEVAKLEHHFDGSDLSEPVKIFREFKPDLVVCDFRLKSGSRDKTGLELLRNMKLERPEQELICVTARLNEWYQDIGIFDAHGIKVVEKNIDFYSVLRSEINLIFSDRN